MSQNIGTLDRIVRAVIGVVLIAYAIPLGFPVTGWNWIGWIGLLPLATAAIASCPLYRLFGISTARKQES